jgi:hypothetical protein
MPKEVEGLACLARAFAWNILPTVGIDLDYEASQGAATKELDPKV